MKRTVLLFLVGTLLFAGNAFAVPTTPTPGSNTTGLTGVNLTIQSVFGILTGIACWLIRFAGVFMVIAIIFYGVKFLISQGDPGKVGDARKALGWAVVGILVIFATYVIIKTVYNAVGGTGSIDILNCSGL